MFSSLKHLASFLVKSKVLNRQNQKALIQNHGTAGMPILRDLRSLLENNINKIKLPLRATCNTFILKEDSKVRKLVFYKDYYDVFIKNQRSRVQAKIFWTIILIENVEKVE